MAGLASTFAASEHRRLKSVREVISSPGQPLSRAVRQLMEPRFSYDFSRVRVHADAAAARSGRDVGAAAYTVGNDIVFGDGQFEPNSPAGLRLIAHELAHVVQDGERHPVTRRLAVSRAHDPAEREAEHTAARAVAGPGLTDVRRSAPFPPVTVSRQAGSPSVTVIHRFEAYEHLELAGDIPGGGRILLDAHRRDLPNHATPTVGWPPEWVKLWHDPNKTKEQERAIQEGLTYGEVTALIGDFYSSVDTSVDQGIPQKTDIAQSVERLNKASLREIWDLIPLVHRPASTAELQQATGGRYLALAKRNVSHFANVPAGMRSMDVWREGHIQAIQLARKGQKDAAWLTNAAADHFLTDTFSGGHLRQERQKLLATNALQLSSRIQHELDSEFGVEVTNRRRDRWIAYGDTYLNTKKDPQSRNRGFAEEAVALSKAEVQVALLMGSIYPEPTKATKFAAEEIVPHPVNVNESRAEAERTESDEFFVIAFTEGGELFRMDDTRIREWLASQPPAAIRDVPVGEKIRMVNRLLDGYVASDDLEAIKRIWVNSGEIDQKLIDLSVRGSSRRANLAAALGYASRGRR